MTGDIYLGRLFGIPFRLHWSWFLAVFLISWSLSVHVFPQTLPEYAGETNWFWGLGVAAALGLFLSVLLHELGHAVVARRFGIQVRGIRLFIFGGVAELGSDPKRAGQEILVALGGPVVTVALIVLYGVGYGIVLGASGLRTEPGEGVLLAIRGGSSLSAGIAALLMYLGYINTFVLAFNMIPAFPLDGGRVLRGVIWAVTGNFLSSTRIAGAIGIGFAWLLFIAAIGMVLGGQWLMGIWFFFLGTFLQNAAQSGIAYAQLQHLLRGVTVAEVMRSQPVTVDARQPLNEIVDQYFLRYPYKAYPVTDNSRYLGLLTLRSVQEIDRHDWSAVHAGDVVSRQEHLPVASPHELVLHAMRKLAESGQSRLAVVENGALVGLLCGRDVMNFMENRAGLARLRGEPTDAETALTTGREF